MLHKRDTKHDQLYDWFIKKINGKVDVKDYYDYDEEKENLKKKELSKKRWSRIRVALIQNRKSSVNRAHSSSKNLATSKL